MDEISYRTEGQITSGGCLLSIVSRAAACLAVFDDMMSILNSTSAGVYLLSRASRAILPKRVSVAHSSDGCATSEDRVEY
jgi:hypothetical protein